MYKEQEAEARVVQMSPICRLSSAGWPRSCFDAAISSTTASRWMKPLMAT
jgi:hypothetical protein